jgi:DNA-directed RNA polymerase specialized sigma24 family protein
MHRSLRREIEAVAVALVARHGTQLLATARRYAATLEDAEDAYQRGLEILLTKAPSTSEADLVPWLKTVGHPHYPPFRSARSLRRSASNRSS